MGYCPSGRLFEAAACGTPILTDAWEGLDAFFRPESEILVAHETDDVILALEASDAELERVASRARQRTLEQHTAQRRAEELERAIEEAASGSPPVPQRMQPGAVVAGAA
jgi:spore maturation protein CgeB